MPPNPSLRRLPRLRPIAPSITRNPTTDRVQGNRDIGLLGGFEGVIEGGDVLDFGDVFGWFSDDRPAPSGFVGRVRPRNRRPNRLPTVTPLFPTVNPGVVDHLSRNFLQPTPIYYRSMKSRSFALPSPTHWESDVSEAFCHDTQRHADQPDPGCNNYTKDNGFPAQVGQPWAAVITSKFMTPHQMIFDPFMYWPISTIAVN
jgi:hypothetical protein